MTSQIDLVNGDILCDKSKVITIPVNTVGVMGKGLAYDFKMKFPSIYPLYKNACQEKLLIMGHPLLIKKDKWFLLFPTKTHWKYNSDLQGIEEGLKHLVRLSKEENLESIALPALGCGLGNLSWEVVKLTMYEYICQMENIKRITIYLPFNAK